MPKTNSKYWLQKIAGNKKRDKKVNKKLSDSGWLDSYPPLGIQY